MLFWGSCGGLTTEFAAGLASDWQAYLMSWALPVEYQLRLSRVRPNHQPIWLVSHVSDKGIL